MSFFIKKSDEDFNPIFKLLEEMEQLSKQELTRIEPAIRQAMVSGIQDMDYLERITDPLRDLLFSGVGTELYEEYLNYVESFNPQRAKEYRDHDDDMNGVYDDLIEKFHCDKSKIERFEAQHGYFADFQSDRKRYGTNKTVSP
ncbi:hypothetical protein AGMMS50239_20570 [Bacteroidia bacterium]|nr:hypothetical protein AGMMS50239_20570 [Bacteroidia bacterium]